VGRGEKSSLVAENTSVDNLTNEIRGLRERISELERRLTRHRLGESSGEVGSTSESLAERAVAGFFEQPLVMLFIADLVEGRFLRVNQKVCEVLGYSEKEILESSFLDRVHPDDHPKTMQEMERLVARERSAGFRNRHLDANGTYKTFEWTAVSDEDGELCYAMAIDVTED
jgi:PAS domain S-box-containing protein